MKGLGVVAFVVVVGASLCAANFAENALLARPLEAGVVAQAEASARASLQGECFGFSECESCLQNSRCGWCADAELCYEGTNTGPACGSAITTPCTLWVYKEPGISGMSGMCGLAQLQETLREAKQTPRNLD